jgi:hypothetical protein
MPNVFYFGLLGNVNYSIQLINFDDRLTIEKWPKAKIAEFMTEMMDCKTFEVEVRFEDIYGGGNKKSAYCITGQLNDVPQISTRRDEHSSSLWKIHDYYDAFVGKIDDKINLLRLCTKGDVKISFNCFYTVDENGRRDLDASSENNLQLRNWSFHVSPKESDDFNEFIWNTTLPLTHEYLQLAYENFLLSYDVPDDRLSFLSLMIALETLFNDGTQELRYRLARGAAVFLGKSIRESQQIFKDLRKLYDKRSTLVHTGDPKNISTSDLHLLQNYVRDSLRLLIECNLPKKELTDRLTVEAFGALNRIKKLGSRYVG